MSTVAADPLHLLLAAQPWLVTPALPVVHRAIMRFLLDQAGLTAEQVDSGAVTPIQGFGSAANLNIHLHCLVLDGLYACDAEGEPVFVEMPAPTDEALQTVLHKILSRLMRLLARKGVHVEGQVRQRDAFFATNEQFHTVLLDIAGNRWRTQIVADLRRVMKLNRHHSLFKQGRLADSLAEQPRADVCAGGPQRCAWPPR